MAFLLEKGHIPKDELRSVYHSKFPPPNSHEIQSDWSWEVIETHESFSSRFFYPLRGLEDGTTVAFLHKQNGLIKQEQDRR